MKNCLVTRHVRKIIQQIAFIHIQFLTCVTCKYYSLVALVTVLYAMAVEVA